MMDYKTFLWYRNGKDSIGYNKMYHFYDLMVGQNSVVTNDQTFLKFNTAFG